MAEELLDPGARPAADLAHHRAALADQDLLLALGLGVDADVDAPVVDLDHLGRDRVRHLLLRQPQRLLAHELGDPRLERHVGHLVRPGSSSGPSGSSEIRSSRSSSIPSPVFALTGCSAWKSPSVAAVLHLRRDVAGLQAVDLVERRSRPGTPSAKTRRATNLSPAPIRSRALTTSSTASTSSAHRLVDAAPASARSAGRSAAASRAGRRARAARRRVVCTPRMRWRVVCGTRETIATFVAGERVHERRLADVRPPGDGDEARPSSREVPGVGQQLRRRGRARSRRRAPR